MAARREALARDITSIHGDEFMRVYGYRKVWRQLLDQGWDPLEAGRDQVARIMRELGLRGVRVFCFNVCSTGSAVFFRSVG